MIIDGKVCPIKKRSSTVSIIYLEMVSEEVAKLHNPLDGFLDSIKKLEGNDRAIALKSFYDTGAYQCYPRAYWLVASSALPVIQYLVRKQIPSYSGEVTEENKGMFIDALDLFARDPDLAMILDMKYTRDHQ